MENRMGSVIWCTMQTSVNNPKVDYFPTNARPDILLLLDHRDYNFLI